ncbi:MAG: hypothetical protein AAB214_11945, partial [Fibrobacterota bacterium]
MSWSTWIPPTIGDGIRPGGNVIVAPMMEGSRIRRWLAARFSLGIVLIGLVSAASEVQAADGLATLKPAHPRLLFSNDDFARTKAWTISDSLTRKAYVSLKAKAEQILSKPVLTYTTDGTPENRLLAVSREALERISLLAAMYRMDGDVRYLDGAVLAMKTVAAFPDWHPPHFLDVAEMTFAM